MITLCRFNLQISIYDLFLHLRLDQHRTPGVLLVLWFQKLMF